MDQGKKIPIGIEFYKEMVRKDYYYVDKTLLIKDILDSGSEVSLFTRPRRFGKTLALTMLQAFFEDERDDKGAPIDNSRFFIGKKIMGCGEQYCSRMGRYPVIFLTLKSAKQPTFEIAYQVLRNDYAEEFGFTPPEARQMLAYYGMESRFAEAEKWYDGYLFGETEVYNPWSILNYVAENRKLLQVFPKPYWSNTSSNSIIRELIEAANPETKTEIEKLIAGGSIEKPVHEDITYGDIHESQDNLWNFLFFTGYLKKVGQRQDAETIYIEMSIPNLEIAYIYKNTILTWFRKKVKAFDRKPLYDALLSGDCAALETIVKKQLMESISFYDEAEQREIGYEHYVKYGVCFCRKTCKIKGVPYRNGGQ